MGGKSKSGKEMEPREQIAKAVADAVRKAKDAYEFSAGFYTARTFAACLQIEKLCVEFGIIPDRRPADVVDTARVDEAAEEGAS